MNSHSLVALPLSSSRVDLDSGEASQSEVGGK